MSGSILETIRSSHEDIDCLEEASSRALLFSFNRVLDVSSEHCVDFFTHEISSRAEQLVESYNDVDSSLTDELNLLSGESKVDVWREFYGRLQGVRDFSRTHPEYAVSFNQHGTQFWYDQGIAIARANHTKFTEEEAGGKYLDLAESHMKFLNLRRLRQCMIKTYVQSQWSRYLKQKEMQHENEILSFAEFARMKEKMFKPLDYISWLKQCSSFDWIPRNVKYKQSDYEQYLVTLDAYLGDFQVRLRPMYDVRTLAQKFEQAFATAWSKREVPGWSQLTAELPYYTVVSDKIFSSSVALEGHIASKEYTKAYARFETLTSAEKDIILDCSRTKDYAIALLEARIQFFIQELGEIIERTIEHVTRKQARTAREVELELLKLEQGDFVQRNNENDVDAASSEGEEVDLDHDNRAIYNPKNLPLGPDGKPIPFWQYKLFGLDKEFVCEICGNHIYFGRRAFDKHFSEWRHINGLRALRIQSSNHFFGITGIQEAILLHDRLRKQTVSSIFNADKEMECEDAMGNVMSYKAYQDLLRQGLV